MSEDSSWNPIKMIIEPEKADESSHLCSLQSSPDAKIVACGYSNSTVRLWTMTTGDIIYDLKFDRSPINYVHSICFSRDSWVIIVACSLFLRAYRVRTGEVVWRHRGKLILHAATSKDQDICALAHCDRSISLLSTATGEKQRSLVSSQDRATVTKGVGEAAFVGFSTMSTRHIVFASFHKLVFMWDTATGQCLHRFEALRGIVCPPVLLSGVDSLLVTMVDDGTVQVTNVLTGQCVSRFTGTPNSKHDNQMVVSNNARYIAFEDGNGLDSIESGGVWIYELSGFKPLAFVPRSADLRRALLSFSADGELLIQAADSRMLLWSTSMLQEKNEEKTEASTQSTTTTTAGYRRLSYSFVGEECFYQHRSDGQSFISTRNVNGGYGNIVIWSSLTGQHLWSSGISPSPYGTKRQILSSDWKHVIEFTPRGVTRIWVAGEPKCERVFYPPFPIHHDIIPGSHWSYFSLNLQLCVILGGGRVTLWSMEEREVIWQDDYETPEPPYLSITPNWKTLMYSYRSISRIRRLKRNNYIDIPLEGEVFTQAISPNSAWICAQHAIMSNGCRTGRICLSLCSTDKRVHLELSGYNSNPIGQLAFSPRSEKISALGLDHGFGNGNTQINVWSVPAGQCIAIWHSENQAIADSLIFGRKLPNFHMENESWIATVHGKVHLPLGDDGILRETRAHGLGMNSHWITWNGIGIVRLPPGKNPRKDGVGRAHVCAVGDHSVGWVSSSRTFCAIGFHPGIPPLE